MKNGIIKWFNHEKGFGFVECENGEEFFLHKSEIKEDELGLIEIGKEIIFEINDRKLAVNVSLKGE